MVGWNGGEGRGERCEEGESLVGRGRGRGMEGGESSRQQQGW